MKELIEEMIRNLYKQLEKYYLISIINSEEIYLEINSDIKVSIGEDGDLVIPNNDIETLIPLIEYAKTKLKIRKRLYNSILKDLIDYIYNNHPRLARIYEHSVDLIIMDIDRPDDYTLIIYYNYKQEVDYFTINNLSIAYTQFRYLTQHDKK